MRRIDHQVQWSRDHGRDAVRRDDCSNNGGNERGGWDRCRHRGSGESHPHRSRQTLDRYLLWCGRRP